MEFLLVVLVLGFAISFVVSLYFWAQTVRHRQPGSSPLNPGILWGDGLTDQGLHYWRLYYRAVTVGVIIGVIAILVWLR